MNKTIQMLEESLLSIRSGVITANLIDTIKVLYYGQMTPIKNLAQTNNDKQKIIIIPYDILTLNDIQKTLENAGFNVYKASKISLVVTFSLMDGTNREKVKIQIKKLGEEAKISIRNLRKQFRKNLDILTEDIKCKQESEIQKLTLNYENKIDQMIQTKLKTI